MMPVSVPSIRFGLRLGRKMQTITQANMLIGGRGFRQDSTRPLGLHNRITDILSISINKITRRAFSEGGPKDGSKAVEQATQQTWLQRFLGPKEMPERNTPRWYREMVLLCTVFAITGSSTMFLVRPAMSKGLGLKGSFRDGPWSYRICSIVIMTPLYATLLVCVGTVFGRHAYFRHFAVKMFSRFGIPPELMDSTFHETAKNFRKW